MQHLFNVTNDFQEDTNVTLYVYNSTDAFVTSKQTTLINGTDLISGEGQANIAVQLNETDTTYKFYWFAGNASVNATTQNTTGPSVNSPFVSGSEAYSPLYGNPNQNYVFNATLNSTAGVNVTPMVYVVDSSDVVQYSAVGSTISDNNGVAYGISTATVNITTTGNWRYFWNTSINGYGVRYPVSGYLTGPTVNYYHFKYFNVPANMSQLTVLATWDSLYDGNLEPVLTSPSQVEYTESSSAVSLKRKGYEKVIFLPGLGTYNVTKYYGTKRMILSNPESGQWTVRISPTNVTEFKIGYEYR